MKAFFTLCLLSLGSLFAVGYRHDVGDGEYLKLGANEGEYEAGEKTPDFSCVCAISETLEKKRKKERKRIIGSGVLIAPDKILTAAHVAVSETPPFEAAENLEVLFGVDAENPTSRHRVVSTAFPEGLEGRKVFRALLGYGAGNKATTKADFLDIAVLTIDPPVKDQDIVPAFWSEEAPEEGAAIFLSGYGNSGPGDDPKEKNWIQARHRRAATNVVDRVITEAPQEMAITGGILACDFDNGTKERNSLDEDLPGPLLAAFGEGDSEEKPSALEGACYPGDSGGPMFAKVEGEWRVVGIASYGTGFPLQARRSKVQYGEIFVYTHVPSHADFLKAAIDNGQAADLEKAEPDPER